MAARSRDARYFCGPAPCLVKRDGQNPVRSLTPLGPPSFGGIRDRQRPKRVIHVSCGAFGIGPVYYRMLPSQRAYQAGTVDQEPTFRSRCEPGGFRPQVGRSPRRASDTGSGRPVASIVGKTHTGRTCCDNDLLKSSDHLILPSPAHGERVLAGCNWGSTLRTSPGRSRASQPTSACRSSRYRGSPG